MKLSKMFLAATLVAALKSTALAQYGMPPTAMSPAGYGGFESFDAQQAMAAQYAAYAQQQSYAQQVGYAQQAYGAPDAFAPPSVADGIEQASYEGSLPDGSAAGCANCGAGGCDGSCGLGGGRLFDGSLRQLLYNSLGSLYHGATGSERSLGGVWYADAEVIFMTRSVTDRPLVLNVDNGDTLLSAGDLDFGVEGGGKVRIARISDRGPGVEFGYFGIYGWESDETVRGLNNLTLPGDIALASFDFIGADVMRIDYGSDLDSFELSMVRPYGHLWFYTGLRHFGIDESFRLRSTDFGTGTSDINVSTVNRLYGIQAGMRGEYDFYSIGVDIIGKTGIFGNAGEQQQSIRDLDNTILLRDPRIANKDGGSVSFMGEAGISLTFPLSEYFTLRAGYNVLVLTGLALATEELDFTDTITSGTQIDQDGITYMHGGNVGIEARW